MLFECEDFKTLGDLKPVVDSRCSPGTGLSCVVLPRGGAISTRIAVDIAGKYTVFTRCIRDGRPAPVLVLLDDQPVTPINARAGQTLFAGTITLSKGVHTLTLKAPNTQEIRADFVVLTNDPNIAGYDFPIRATAIE